MAALTSIVILFTFTLGLASATTGVFDHIFDGVDSCHDTCDNTYAAHTYENGNEADSCKRGCRFHSIMALIHDHADNETMADCISSCREAYSSNSHNSSEVDACMVGCHSQPVAPPEQDTDNDAEAMAHMLYPLMYMHSMYSNMLDHVYQRMEYSWSIFRQGDQVVLVRSQPVIISFVTSQDSDREGEIPEDTPWPDDRTSSQVETNIAGQDNSATPFFSFAFGPSQLRSSRSMASPHDMQMDVQVDQGRSDWLSCVARKTGIARIILCFLILATAVVMIWFCLSAAATAPEQQLSINGDLEYLRSGQDKGAYLKLLNPQSRVEARPLPIKIRVEQI